MPSQNLFNALVFVLITWGAWSDHKTRTIPLVTTVGLLIAALLAPNNTGYSALLTFIILFVILMPFYLKKLLPGGDIKIIPGLFAYAGMIGGAIWFFSSVIIMTVYLLYTHYKRGVFKERLQRYMQDTKNAHISLITTGNIKIKTTEKTPLAVWLWFGYVVYLFYYYFLH